MRISEIDVYLRKKNKTLFDHVLLDEIEQLRQEAISNNNEDEANLCWCYKEIFIIQERFVKIYNDLKNKNYDDAWYNLERESIHISNLLENFDVCDGVLIDCKNKQKINNTVNKEYDPYQIIFITNEVKQFIKLFPYKLFTSREEIIEEEICSICGKKTTLRNGCNHKTGKLYMGELCTKKVTKWKLIGVAIVRSPFDMYAVIKPSNGDYNYAVIKETMEKLESPYDRWYVEILPVLKKEFNEKKIKRNDPCPCNSGRKFKKCCMNTDKMYTEHYKVTVFNSSEDVPFKYLY